MFRFNRKVVKNTKHLFQKKHFILGWGRKKSGYKAIRLAQKNGVKFLLLEDGFIRSLGLGVNGSPAFSIVGDDIGIYYDATVASKLENLLNSDEVFTDTTLLKSRGTVNLAT